MVETMCITWKRKALEKYYSHLNAQQQKAVFCVKGPLLVLAGAGSGKTTAIIHRIVNMIYFGNGYEEANEYLLPEDADWLKGYLAGTEDLDLTRMREILAICPIPPWQILAITFTNKAAEEMRVRLVNAIGEDMASQVHASTFHSACVRILRRNIGLLGYDNNFAIYDTEDAKRLMKDCIASCGVSEKQFSPRTVLHEISMAKDAMISPEEMLQSAGTDYRQSVIAKLYQAYQAHLRRSNAVDFDDIIFLTVQLFREFPEELEKYQKRFRYVLVDEYQDTNYAQYALISLLTKADRNLCVVGDDDQSIYRFRGATIENILGFEREFHDCTVIRLEQNYRSTQTILDAANSVIAHNMGRKEKHLWTDIGKGTKITWFQALDEQNEADYVAASIQKDVDNGGQYHNHAILYRMNAQSNMLERSLVRAGIPYRIYGGMRFYDRKEIKDILAYMSIIENPQDLVRLERIINEPKRGIGAATAATLREMSQDLHLTPLEIMREAGQYPALSKKARILQEFAGLWDSLIEAAESCSLEDLLDIILEKTGYGAFLQGMGEEGSFRLENIEELKTSIITYEEESAEPSLSEFLEEISLYMDVDKYEPDEDTVMLMTIHAAKGLEFQNVYIVGMEQGIFPGFRSMESPIELEEERRLAYVALTRAKYRLVVTTTSSRRLFGTTMRNLPSQFLKEIDSSLIQQERTAARTPMMSSIGNQTAPSSISLQSQMAARNQQRYQSSPKTFQVGDRVHHSVFGEGTVLSVSKIANDALIEVGFDQIGTKKFMASHPKIRKI